MACQAGNAVGTSNQDLGNCRSEPAAAGKPMPGPGDVGTGAGPRTLGPDSRDGRSLRACGALFLGGIPPERAERLDLTE